LAEIVGQQRQVVEGIRTPLSFCQGAPPVERMTTA
jgi:hypothetical protein